MATAGARRVPSRIMQNRHQPVDIVMAGTFAAWRLGTLQARALPIARALRRHDIHCAIVTVPWDMPSEVGVVDSISGVALYNAQSNSATIPLAAISQQMRRIRALNPRAVHVFKPKGFGGFSGRLIARNLPILIDSDDWEGDGGWNQLGSYSHLQQRIFDWQERTLLRDASAVSAASQLLVQRARSLRRRSAETVAWVPNGLDDDWTSRLASARVHPAGTSAKNLTVGLYSRFVEFPDDWLPRFLTELSSKISDSPEVTVMIIGESPGLGAGFRNLKLERMGYVALNRIPELLGRVDIAVYPYADSLASRSKNSVKLLELMASGCAIVASAVGDIPAVVGRSARLMEDSSPEAFALATSHLIDDRFAIQRSAERTKARVQRLFSIDATTRRLVDLYRRIGILPPCSPD